MPLNSLGHRMLGISMQNCTNWVVAEQACYYLDAVTVPMYETLTPATMAFVVAQSEMTTVVCSSKSVENVVKGCVSEGSNVHNIIVVDVADNEPLAPQKLRSLQSSYRTLRFYRFHEIVRVGEAYPSPPTPPVPSSLATLCYTSGTTGDPKGAMITHGNMLAASSSGLEGFIRATADDVYLSFLPLPHIFERLVVNSLLACGCTIGFFRSNPMQILDDAKALEPTIFCAVPRLLNRIYDKVIQGANARPDSIAAALFNTGLRTKVNELRASGARDHWLWDRLIFRKLRTAVGLRRVRILLSGGAPLAAEVMEFFRVVLGQSCTCHEGYGQTETAGGTTMTAVEDDSSVGHVGTPFPASEIKLVDVPDMGYLHTDVMHGMQPCMGRGEIWVRGSNVFQGYYKDERGTRDALTEDGWLKSGDIGIWLPEGQLQIVDRKKNIFKLAQGEFVAVEKIEGTLGQAPLVAMLFVHGETTESSLVAVVVVDEDAYISSLQAAMGGISLDQALRDARTRQLVIDAVLNQLNEVGRAANLKGYELIKAVHLEASPWTVDEALPILTPTLKLQRNKAKERYKAVLEDLFKQTKTAARAKL